MERLILVRHGFPDHMADGRTGGWTDSHLTDLGRRQAQATARRVVDLLADRPYSLYTSDLSRARETAEAIAGALGVEPLAEPALREQDLGRANEKSTTEADEMALPADEGPLVDRVFYPEAETWREMMQRVFGFLDSLSERSDETVVLVSHAGAGACVVFWWLGLTPDRWPSVQFEFDLCSLTELITGNFGGHRILRLNDVRHLGDLHV